MPEGLPLDPYSNPSADHVPADLDIFIEQHQKHGQPGAGTGGFNIRHRGTFKISTGFSGNHGNSIIHADRIREHGTAAGLLAAAGEQRQIEEIDTPDVTVQMGKAAGIGNVCNLHIVESRCHINGGTAGHCQNNCRRDQNHHFFHSISPVFLVFSTRSPDHFCKVQ